MRKLSIVVFLVGCVGAPVTQSAECDAGIRDGGAYPFPPGCVDGGAGGVTCGPHMTPACVSVTQRWTIRDGMCWLGSANPVMCSPSTGLAVCPAGEHPACILDAWVSGPNGELMWCGTNR